VGVERCVFGNCSNDCNGAVFTPLRDLTVSYVITAIGLFLIAATIAPGVYHTVSFNAALLLLELNLGRGLLLITAGSLGSHSLVGSSSPLVSLLLSCTLFDIPVLLQL
jgi:hypothetical protein